MNVLLAGGAGFLGKNFASYWRHEHPESRIVIVDTLRRHRSDIPLLDELGEPGDVTIVEGDVADVDLVTGALRAGEIDVLVNFACDARVERAASNPRAAVRSNVTSVVSLLEAARQHPGLRFHQVSSAEVFGAAPARTATEAHAYMPRTPYGATKAAADHFVRTYHEYYGLDATISIAPNVCGPYQHPDQALPRFVTNGIDGVALPVYGDGRCVREWLHVSDHSRGIGAVVEHGGAGQTYNLGSGQTRTVARLAAEILERLDRPATLVQRLPDRRGHASRPVLDSAKARHALGWWPTMTFEDALQHTIDWYVANRSWWADRSTLAGSEVGAGHDDGIRPEPAR